MDKSRREDRRTVGLSCMEEEMSLRKIHILRRIVQLISFLLIPELFAATFAACGQIMQILVRNQQSCEALREPIGVLLITFPVTMIFGRFFCGWFCAFGATEDFFWFLGRALRFPEIRMSPRTDDLMKKIKYFLFMLFVAVFWPGLIRIAPNASPWHAFLRVTDIEHWPGFMPLMNFGGLLLVIILILSMFGERFFCRYLCPMGAIFSPLSRIRYLHIRKPQKNCGDCQKCTDVCPSGIQLYELNKVKSGECINCLQCVEECPKKNAQMKPHPVVAIILSIALIAGLYLLNEDHIHSVTGAAAAEQHPIIYDTSRDS